MKTFVQMAFALMTNSLVACPLITLTRKTTGLKPLIDFFQMTVALKAKFFPMAFALTTNALVTCALMTICLMTFVLMPVSDYSDTL